MKGLQDTLHHGDKEKPDYKAINGQVAKLAFDNTKGEWKIIRFLKDRERLPIMPDVGCVRPQQLTRRPGAVGRQGRS